MSTPPVIQVQDLVKEYGGKGEPRVRAVAGMTFTIERGEHVAIVGPSGCGKSSLMHVLGCLDRPSSGSYRLAGEDVSNLHDDALASVRNRRIGFVFQAFHLLARQSALENVELPLLYAGIRPTRPRAMASLERVGLAKRATHHPNQLSGGERQRVAIARALVTRPELILADEPTGALDTRTGLEILDLLDELVREGSTLVVVTHDIGVARRAKRVIRIRDGVIEKDSTPEEVLGQDVALLAGAH